jgi:uncharacterized protein
MFNNEALTTKERQFIKAQLKLLYEQDFTTLSALAPTEIFNASELKTFNRINSVPVTDQHFLRPHSFLIMKATRLCNLRCTYCHSWKDGPNQRMSFEVLCKTIKEALEDSNTRTIDFIWHGGETLIMPRAFYSKALWLQRYYKRDYQKISNGIQTNATLLDAEWIDFFKKYNFSIGVSLDGPDKINDRKRIFKNGAPTSHIITEKLKLLQQSGLKYGLLLVIDEDTIAMGPKTLLTYLVNLGVTNIALLNVIPDSHDNGSLLGFTPYIQFLITLFDEWWNHYKDSISIRELVSLVKQIEGMPPSVCIFAGNCLGQFLTVEPEGDIAACDKYIGNKEYYFGNIKDDHLSQLIRQSVNYNLKSQQLNEERQSFSACEHYSICNGGCPHDNLMQSKQQGAMNTCCGFKPLINHIKNCIL